MYYPSTIVVLLNLFRKGVMHPSTIPVLSKYYPSTIPVLSQYYPSTIPVLSQQGLLFGHYWDSTEIVLGQYWNRYCMANVCTIPVLGQIHVLLPFWNKLSCTGIVLGQYMLLRPFRNRLSSTGILLGQFFCIQSLLRALLGQYWDGRYMHYPLWEQLKQCWNSSRIVHALPPFRNRLSITGIVLEQLLYIELTFRVLLGQYWDRYMHYPPFGTD